MRFNKIVISIFTVVLVIFSSVLIIGFDIEKKEIPIHISISIGKNLKKINCWNNEAGECYIFLPSFSKQADVKIYSDTDNSVFINKTKIKDGMSCDNFEFNVPYNLTYSSFGKTHKYKLTFIKSDNIPSMYIDTESGSMDYIHSKKGNEEEGNLSLYNSDGSINHIGKIESINGRGNNTWDGFDKKPYSIKLENEANLLGMGKAQKWILLANADDLSNLRNKLVYDFADKIGLEYSPDSEWVDLYLNGEYAGLYLLCERNEVHTERVNIPEEKSFLFSLEPTARLSQQNYTHILTSSQKALRVHCPAKISEKQLNSVSEIWQSAENAIFADNGIDPLSKTNWQDLIDLESWAKKYLIEEVFGNLDGDMASQYFYIYDNINNKKIYAGPVWDFDKSLGNDNDSKWAVTNPETFVVSRYWGYYHEYPQWFEKLYQKDEFKNKVIELFDSLFKPEIEILLNEKLTVYSEKIATSCKMNEIRWDLRRDSLNNGIYQITNYLEKHTQFLNGVFLDKKEYCRVSFINLENNLFYCLPVGECLRKLPEIQDTDTSVFCGLYYLDSDEPFDITKPIYEDTAIYAKWQDKNGERVKDILKLTPVAVIAVIFIAVFVIDIKRNWVAKNE